MPHEAEGTTAIITDLGLDHEGSSVKGLAPSLEGLYSKFYTI
jgi:hypothetical protein